MVPDTIITARWRLSVINEWYREAQHIDTRPFLRNMLAAQTIESKIECDLLHLKASGFQVFFCAEADEYQFVGEEEKQEEGRSA